MKFINIEVGISPKPGRLPYEAVLQAIDEDINTSYLTAPYPTANQCFVTVSRTDLRNFLRRDLNRLVMDYLVIEGYKEAAENFARESGLEPLLDFESIQSRMNVRNAIQQGNVQEAIERINDLNPEVSLSLFCINHVSLRLHNNAPLSAGLLYTAFFRE